jgi:hypothetical protein
LAIILIFSPLPTSPKSGEETKFLCICDLEIFNQFMDVEILSEDKKGLLNEVLDAILFKENVQKQIM